MTPDRDPDAELTEAEFSDPWTHLYEAKRRIKFLDALVKRQGDRLRDYAEAQDKAMPDLVSYLKVAAVTELSSMDKIITIRPDAYDIRFQPEFLQDIRHPENVADMIYAAGRRYADDLFRKIASVANPRWLTT